MAARMVLLMVVVRAAERVDDLAASREHEWAALKVLWMAVGKAAMMDSSLVHGWAVKMAYFLGLKWVGWWVPRQESALVE